MKRTLAIVATLVLLALGSQAFAEICTIDAVPAATLLLPYFEVDYTTADSNKALTTFFSVNNASAAPALAHVVLWTNISLPTIDFDLYLTGYDVQTVNLRTLFRDGTLPVTATSAQDTAGDTISPHGGAFSDNPAWDDPTAPNPDIQATTCNTFFPFRNPALTATNLARVQRGHTGQPISGNSCLGLDVGKTTTVDGETVRLAIGYITIDSVSRCSVQFPQDTGYFADGGTGVANNRNVLWGDFFIVDPANAAAFGDTLVHIEADAAVINESAAAGTTDFSFYSRFGNANDNREPLANAFATRYQTGGAFSGGTRLAVWRDSRIAPGNLVTCGTSPFGQLEESQVVAFNEREDAVELCEEGGQVSPPQPDIACFPYEINWVDVGGPVLAPPFDNGWLFLGLDLDDLGAANARRSQAWVTTVMTALGLYQVGFPAVQLNSSCFGLAGGIDGDVGEIDESN